MKFLFLCFWDKDGAMEQMLHSLQGRNDAVSRKYLVATNYLLFFFSNRRKAKVVLFLLSILTSGEAMQDDRSVHVTMSKYRCIIL